MTAPDGHLSGKHPEFPTATSLGTLFINLGHALLVMNVVLACSCDSSSEYSSQEDVVEADETVLLPLRITVLEDAADDDETEEEDMAEPAGEGTQGRRAEPTGLAISHAILILSSSTSASVGRAGVSESETSCALRPKPAMRQTVKRRVKTV